MSKKQRYRVFFSKTEAMRYTGHLDLILTWERTFRRAGLPLAYSQGFTPRPILNLADPLPLGYTSKGEIGDFWLSAAIPSADFQIALEKALPPGLEINRVEEIADLQGGKLPSLVKAASYQVSLRSNFSDLEDKVSALLAAEHLPRSRKNKPYDLRPLIKSLGVVRRSQELPVIQATLTSLPGASGRPDEVLAALDIPVVKASICRTRIHLSDSVVEGD